ncbi:4'-phosphopantetheinyl transferase family protein [Pleomorphovibrio marinus]|uniref:4'-phosphopantetheinyl transferase family protein n=1 Tax=Pleomorphovibrio marinus TaxID=2164132 RepID=UPI000E0CA295|nr:4'-phosphopantetheinyl transferase superfamily protein [Pleomorphovibrio marinus]
MKKIRVTGFDIKNASSDNFEKAMELMPDEIRRKTLRFVQEKDRYAYLLGKVLLQEQLMEEGFSPAQISGLASGEFGKPYLPIDLKFNISHSRDWVLCAAAMGVELGIDIEYKAHGNDLDLTPYLTDAEKEVILESGNNLEEKIRIWTQKEAVLKASGAGIGMDLTKVDTTCGEIRYASKPWFLKEIKVDPEYSSFLASSKPLDFMLQKLVIKQTIDRIFLWFAANSQQQQ